MRELYKMIAITVGLVALWFTILIAIAINSEAADTPVMAGVEHVAGFDGELLLAGNLPVICTTSTEYELIVHIVMAEAEGEPLEGKIAVANVVINRVRNRGQSVAEVIFAPAQFCTSERFELEPTEDCYKAVDMALQGYEAVDRDVEYFCEKSITFDYLTYVKSIGNHDFYKEKH